MSYFTDCGEELKDNAKFCTSCGTIITADSEIPTPKVLPYKVESNSSFGGGYSINQIIDGNKEYRYMSSGPKGWASTTEKNRDTWITFYFDNIVDIQRVVITTAPTRPYRLHSFSIIKYQK